MFGVCDAFEEVGYSPGFGGPLVHVGFEGEPPVEPEPEPAHCVSRDDLGAALEYGGLGGALLPFRVLRKWGPVVARLGATGTLDRKLRAANSQRLTVLRAWKRRLLPPFSTTPDSHMQFDGPRHMVAVARARR